MSPHRLPDTHKSKLKHRGILNPNTPQNTEPLHENPRKLPRHARTQKERHKSAPICIQACHEVYAGMRLTREHLFDPPSRIRCADAPTQTASPGCLQKLCRVFRKLLWVAGSCTHTNGLRTGTCARENAEKGGTGREAHAAARPSHALKHTLAR